MLVYKLCLRVCFGLVRCCLHAGWVAQGAGRQVPLGHTVHAAHLYRNVEVPCRPRGRRECRSRGSFPCFVLYLVPILHLQVDEQKEGEEVAMRYGARFPWFMVRTLLFGEAFDPWEADEARAIQ